MKIHYLGHAGFLVETENDLLIIDPWLSANGAFDMAWFQYPCNHHLMPIIQQKIKTTTKNIYIYISHEHKDHFDIDFLSSIAHTKITYLIPNYRKKTLKQHIQRFSENDILLINDNGEHQTKDYRIKIYVDDAELNRDSAILIEDKHTGKKFLNLNDCKIYDRLHQIKQEEKEIEIFTCQFSGATWHPTCYEYDAATYENIATQKMQTKFLAVTKAIETVQPNLFFPSAGPACFLDANLFHLNQEPINIFPKAQVFLHYLEKQKIANDTEIIYLMPDDEIELEEKTIINHNAQQIKDENEYILKYQEKYIEKIQNRIQNRPIVTPSKLLIELKEELEKKLKNFEAKSQITIPLYFIFSDAPQTFLKIEFQKNDIKIVSSIQEENYYTIKTYSYDIQQILDKYLTWEDFALTFRMKLNRTPDVYQTLIQGFLILEKEDLMYFSKKMLEKNNDRVIIEVGGSKYLIDKYCPHQMADLEHSWQTDGRYIVCPRHGWRFDLQNGGKCMHNNDTINAICLDEEL
ncbi:MAG: Rieske 2Fe-2S domain-containing protein [Sphingobacteriales bacterium]|nr:MAG: Rieske 2Fe-2S domain-containing protein [Sphingobacteriales bacterium]